MEKIRVFISSVQKEFIEERKALYKQFSNNTLLNNFFKPVRYGTGTGEIFRLTKEAALQEPVFSLEEGFRVILWRKQEVTDQATDQATDQVTGQAEMFWKW